MSSSAMFGRKMPLPRNTLPRNSSYCAPRALGVLILLTTVFVVWSTHRRLDALYPTIGCGSVEDTKQALIVLPTPPTKVFQAETTGEDTHMSRDIEQRARPKVLAFVGIQTGFYSADRRKSLRQTWMPSTPEAVTRLEEEMGLVLRFVIGYTTDARATAQLAQEISIYRDFLRIDNMEEYARLPFKTLAYFKAAYMLFDADFYVKADDDIYLRPDRLSVLLKKHRATSRTYLGCMKKGNVITDPQYKWFEPLGYLLGNEYFYHAYGPIYALSRDIVADLSTFRNDSMRMFSNEDVTIGTWMLAFNVHHEDDRRLCHPTCQPTSIAVWDIPQCSGLCNPAKRLLELHEQHVCSGNAAAGGASE